MEFCSKFIAKFKIISLKLASSPCEIGICAVFCGEILNHTSAVLATPCRLTMRVNLSAQRNKEPIRRMARATRRYDATQRADRLFSIAKAKSGPPIAILKFHGSLICNFEILRGVHS
ncbi:hypothetical protein [uncultured Campylobacter sp.]|uniref:hypothetical protein n=1 Tax=uncultured Campylobacter sp. TaxID=218934 RepID=UPI00261D09BE|nr:hypothetical protein [uncultured Campylobacter sp.]